MLSALRWNQCPRCTGFRSRDSSLSRYCELNLAKLGEVARVGGVVDGPRASPDARWATPAEANPMAACPTVCYSEKVMSTLTDDKVIEIAKNVATANSVSFADIGLAPAVATTGLDAIEIKIILTPGSSQAIFGERSARTVSQVIQRLVDAGEERVPIVRYEEQVAPP
jgi:hypothetical protein